MGAHVETGVPRVALIAAGVIVAASIAAAGIGRITGFGTLRMPEQAQVDYRDLRFADRTDGAVVVRDAVNGQEIAVLPAGGDGFVRGVVRSLVRDRRGRGLGDETPFRLARTNDGRLVLEDRSTATEITLNAFGPTNVAAFARLLDKGGDRR